jgi:hypothetical protein
MRLLVEGMDRCALVWAFGGCSRCRRRSTQSRNGQFRFFLSRPVGDWRRGQSRRLLQLAGRQSSRRRRFHTDSSDAASFAEQIGALQFAAALEVLAGSTEVVEGDSHGEFGLMLMVLSHLLPFPAPATSASFPSTCLSSLPLRGRPPSSPRTPLAAESSQSHRDGADTTAATAAT